MSWKNHFLWPDLLSYLSTNLYILLRYYTYVILILIEKLQSHYQNRVTLNQSLLRKKFPWRAIFSINFFFYNFMEYIPYSLVTRDSSYRSLSRLHKLAIVSLIFGNQEIFHWTLFHRHTCVHSRISSSLDSRFRSYNAKSIASYLSCCV